MRRRIGRRMFECRWVRHYLVKTTLKDQRAFGRRTRLCNCAYSGCQGWQMAYQEGVLAR